MGDSTKITVTNIQAVGEAEGEVLTVTGAGNVIASGISQGTIDHGELDGLDGDDHTQYLLLAGETTDAKLHSGADLIVYSDAGSTEKARIDGATGNITTEGTVDGKDVAGHVDTATIHFTEGSISHANIADIGDDSHATIDAHIDDTDIHHGLIIPFDYDNTRVSLNNSSSWLTWYSVTIPAGTLGANDSVLVRAFGSNYNQSGSNRTLERRYQIICNGTSTITMVGDTQGTSAFYRPDSAYILFSNEGAVNNNFYYGYWMSHDQLLFGDKNQSTTTYDLTINVQSRWTNAHGNQTVYGFMAYTHILRG